MSSQEWSRPPRTRLPKKEHAKYPAIVISAAEELLDRLDRYQD